MSLEPADQPLPAPVPWSPTPEAAGGLPPDLDWRPPRRHRPLVHLGLLLTTILTTMIAGSEHYAGFRYDFTTEWTSYSLLYGASYSATILAILGTHELGHYFACRYYRVDASLPYFIPAPLFLTGTLGAVIRIRQRIPGKRMLFDIGAAGPIAGFVVAVPALFLGLWLSRVVPLPDAATQLPENLISIEFGEPLLYQFAEWLIWGGTPDGYTLNWHPVATAAWLGLLVTAINLFPVSQLDGGHIAYAVLGSRSTFVTLAALGAVIGMAAFVSISWIVWAILILIMVVYLGPRHPRTVDDHVPLDRRRRIVAAGTVAIFVLCFTPAPIEISSFVAGP